MSGMHVFIFSFNLCVIWAQPPIWKINYRLYTGSVRQGHALSRWSRSFTNIHRPQAPSNIKIYKKYQWWMLHGCWRKYYLNMTIIFHHCDFSVISYDVYYLIQFTDVLKILLQQKQYSSWMGKIIVFHIRIEIYVLLAKEPMLSVFMLCLKYFVLLPT